MRIAVAVSGGTDSFFTLVHLLEQGHQVLALHAHFLSPHGSLDQTARIASACRALGAAFEVTDLSSDFKRLVIHPFVDAYAKGHTPNPCALCNAAMKFGLLADVAQKLGFPILATGHYARLQQDHPACHVYLAQGEDAAKDQSYFLSLVPRARLARALFPLGTWHKQEVRNFLAARGLEAPLPTESQEVCFVPHDDYRAFLGRHATHLPGPGPIQLRTGHVLGRHDGLWRHTEGQRKGLGIAWHEPLYVLEKDLAQNALIVGPKAELEARGCVCHTLNILTPRAQWPQQLLVKTRYRQTPQPAIVLPETSEHSARIEFVTPCSPPATGQVAAMYDTAGRVLAGGIISSVF